MLLDEPTAQLDVRGEAEIFDRLLAATRHCTTILISHRFSTVRHADRICVLEQGRVVELGTHDELMALGRPLSDDVRPAGAALQRAKTRKAGAMTSSPEQRAVASTAAAARALVDVAAVQARLPPRAALLLVGFSLALLAALPDALLALWFKLLGEGVLQGDWTRVRIAASALGAVRHGDVVPADRQHARSAPVPRQGDDRARVPRRALQASIATIAHQERPDYLDRLSVLRDQVFVLDHMYMSLFATCGWILRLGVTIALLVSIHPALVLLACLPCRPCSRRRGGRPSSAARRNAAPRRHGLPGTCSTWRPPPRPARKCGSPASAIGCSASAGRPGSAGNGPIAAARLGVRRLARRGVGALWRRRMSVPIVFVSSGLARRPGDVLLALAAGSRLSFYVGATVGEIGFLRGIWMDAARRLAWLEDYAKSVVATADQPAPARLREGIRFEHVSFAYPGTERLVLDDITLDLPAGTVIAIVGENGAGKSTLVKLLAKMYAPTSGRILVDSTDLAAYPRWTGARGLPAPSRISSVSSSAPVRPSGSAICPAWRTSPRSSRP